MSSAALRLWLCLALCAMLALPDFASAGLFRKRCRHRRQCPPSTYESPRRVRSTQAGCPSGALCPKRLAAKYYDSAGNCVYAMYDAVKCPYAETTHTDSRCNLPCPQYCNSSPCTCLTTATYKTVYESGDKDGSRYTANLAVLRQGLVRKIASEEYLGAKVVNQYVIQLDEGIRVKIVWLRMDSGQYAGTGYQVSNETPLSPEELVFKATRVDLNGKAANAYLVYVSRIGEADVNQEHLVLVNPQ